MEFTCKRCLSRFTFPDERVPETPVELRCISCGAPILIARSLGSTLDRIGAPLPESEGPSSDGLSSLDQAVSELEALMDSAKASYPAGPATVIEEDVDVELEEGDEQSTALLQNLDLDALDALMAAVEEPELERAVAAWPSAPEPAAPEPAAPEPAAPEPAAPELPALLVPPRRFDPSSLRLPRSLAPPVPLSRPLLPDMGSKRAAPPPLPWNVEQHPREEPVAATLATVRRFPPPLPPAAAEEQKTPIAAPSSKLLEVTGALVGRISAASMAAVQEKPSSLRGASSAAAPPPRSLASAAPAAASPAPPPAGAAGGAARPHEVGTRTTSPWFPTSTAKLAAAMPERLAAAEAGPAGAPPLPAAEPEPETAAEPELTTEPEPEAAAEPELAAEPEPETAAEPELTAEPEAGVETEMLLAEPLDDEPELAVMLPEPSGPGVQPEEPLWAFPQDEIVLPEEVQAAEEAAAPSQPIEQEVSLELTPGEEALLLAELGKLAEEETAAGEPGPVEDYPEFSTEAVPAEPPAELDALPEQLLCGEIVEPEGTDLGQLEGEELVPPPSGLEECPDFAGQPPSPAKWVIPPPRFAKHSQPVPAPAPTGRKIPLSLLVVGAIVALGILGFTLYQTGMLAPSPTDETAKPAVTMTKPVAKVVPAAKSAPAATGAAAAPAATTGEATAPTVATEQEPADGTPAAGSGAAPAAAGDVREPRLLEVPSYRPADPRAVVVQLLPTALRAEGLPSIPVADGALAGASAGQVPALLSFLQGRPASLQVDSEVPWSVASPVLFSSAEKKNKRERIYLAVRQSQGASGFGVLPADLYRSEPVDKIPLTVKIVAKAKKVSGGMAAQAKGIDAALGQSNGMLAACFADHLSGAARGKLQTELAVDASGTIQEVKVVAGDEHDGGQPTTCVLGVLRGLSLKPPKEAAPSVIKVNVAYRVTVAAAKAKKKQRLALLLRLGDGEMTMTLGDGAVIRFPDEDGARAVQALTEKLYDIYDDLPDSFRLIIIPAARSPFADVARVLGAAYSPRLVSEDGEALYEGFVYLLSSDDPLAVAEAAAAP